MAKRLRVLAIAAAAVLSLVLWRAWDGPTQTTAADPWPPLEVNLTATSGQGTVTYAVTIKNITTVDLTNVEIRGAVPKGATYVDSYQAGPGDDKGKFDGTSVNWITGALKPGTSKGPFNYQVKADATAASYVWLRWQGKQAGQLTTAEVSAAGGTAAATNPAQIAVPTPTSSATANPPAQTTVPTAAKPSEFPLAKVKGITTADNITYPGGKVSITLSKPNAQQNLVTTGLDNVGVGTYVYLEGRDVDAKDKKVKSWSWSLSSAPAGSTAALEAVDSRTERFLADKVGEYAIKVVATNEEGTSSSSTLTVTAGRYAGTSLCTSCHNGTVAKDIATPFSKTGHATKFETTFNSYVPPSEYCVKCHTTGYDETAKNGGFDDVAREAGWDPARDGPLVAWIKNQNKTLADIKNDPAMGGLINIGCESCHGPGGSAHTGAKTYDVGACAQCHSAQPAQWAASKHSIEPPAEMAGSTSCVECHSGQGFVEVKMRGKTPVFPDQATAQKPATLMSPGEQPPISCATCHDPHTATYPYQSGGDTKSLQLRIQGEVKLPNGATVDAGVSATCVTCHANKRDVQYKADFIAGTKARGVHDNPQADVFYGTGAYDYGQKFSNSAHTTLLKEGCTTCHMAANPVANNGPDGVAGTKDDVIVNSVGGHSFAVQGEYQDPKGGAPVKVENVGACQQCHAGLTDFNRPAAKDYDGDGKVEGIQDEVQGLLDLLAAKLPKDDKGEVISETVSATNTTEAQRKALWNYFLIKNDGSLGLHNPAFAVQVLQTTYKQLTGTDVPGAALR